MRSDAGINLDFLRGEVTEVEEANQEEGIDEADQEDDHASEEDEDEPMEVGIADYEEGSDFQEVDRDYSGPTQTYEAGSGEGLTHLARRAAQNHNRSQDLTAEQMVYVEDYIQKNLNHSTGWLELGESVQIPDELVEEAIGQAEQLTEDQLQNLTQYTLS